MEELVLDTVATHWREALDDAEDALEKLSHNRRLLGLSAPELQARFLELRAERETTDLDLMELAGTTHVPLHRRLTGPRASC